MTSGRKIKQDKNIGTSIALSPKALGIVDENRGQQSRSRWINDLILTVYGEPSHD
jgi:hypothetical protein